MLHYQSAVGSLLHVSGWTRPDIAFAVSNVARFCSSPSKEHWTAVKRILRYLKGTSNYGLSYLRNDNNDTLVGYSDADWAGDVNDCKSTSGYLFMMSGAAVSWKSQKLALAIQEATWTRQLLNDLCNSQIEPTVELFALPKTCSTTARPNTLILSIIMFERKFWTALSS